MKIAIPKFPGASGAEDIQRICIDYFKQDAEVVDCDAENLRNIDAVIIPGGVSFGDYLRPAGLAKATNISGALRKFAKDGGPMLGIGNGFQLLCELGLLPGAFLANRTGGFINQVVHLKVESTRCAVTRQFEVGEVIALPVAHSFGAYYADPRTIRELDQDEHIAFRYCNQFGDVNEFSGFNGSLSSIASIISRHENIVGMMAHPERAVDELYGNTIGHKIFSSFLNIESEES